MVVFSGFEWGGVFATFLLRYRNIKQNGLLRDGSQWRGIWVWIYANGGGFEAGGREDGFCGPHHLNSDAVPCDAVTLVRAGIGA